MIIVPSKEISAVSYGYNILYPQLFKTLIQDEILKYDWIKPQECSLDVYYNDIVKKDFTSNNFLNIKSLYDSLVTIGMIFPFLNKNQKLTYRGGHRLIALQNFNNQDKWLMFYPNPNLKFLNNSKIYYIPKYINNFKQIEIIEVSDLKEVIIYSYKFSDMTGGGARNKKIKLIPHSFFNDPILFEEFLLEK